MFTVDLHLVVKGKPAAVPTLGQIYSQGILSGKHPGHIIGLIVQMGGIVSKTGGKQSIADFFTIDLRFIKSQSSYRQSRLFYVIALQLLLKDFHGALLIWTARGDKMFL